jgi:hypothetical protein
MIVIATEGYLLTVEGGVAMSEAANVSEFVQEGGEEVVFSGGGGVGFGDKGAAREGGKFTPV